MMSKIGGFLGAVLVFHQSSFFLISLRLFLISLLLIGFNGGLDYEELFIGLGIHIVTFFCCFEA